MASTDHGKIITTRSTSLDRHAVAVAVKRMISTISVSSVETPKESAANILRATHKAYINAATVADAEEAAFNAMKVAEIRLKDATDAYDKIIDAAREECRRKWAMENPGM